jgi:exonuclease SbcD
VSVGLDQPRRVSVGLVVCHTADWHLGRTLHGASFDDAHRRFLSWLCARIVEHAVDVLVIAGDVFDRSVPAASAEALFYEFLAQLAADAPGVQVLVVAGNHDGPARLMAPAPLLACLGGAGMALGGAPPAVGRLPVHLVGRLPVDASGGLEVDGLVLPLRTRAGALRGHLVAVPFLRPSDLSRVEGGARAAERTRVLYELAVGRAIERGRAAGIGLVLAAGHGHVRGARLSPESERPLLGGEDAAVPIDVFPPALAYVALGHLHLPQVLGGGRVRYAGAPLPLAFSERSYPHQILIAREAGGGIDAEAVRVPAFVRLTRLEADGGGPLSIDDALARLAAWSDGSRDEEHWVQACVRVTTPRPALKRELLEALARGRSTSRALRLVSVEVERSGDAAIPPMPTGAYGNLSPEAVLARVWAGTSREPLPETLTRALWEAWEEARKERDEERAELPELELGVAS